MNDINEVNAQDGSSALSGSLQEDQASCHVLMNSRRYGTTWFACKGVEDAAQTLSWLALRAEREQRQDGAQRFFCLLPPTLPTDEPDAPLLNGPVTPESEGAIVVCLADGNLQWIAGDELDERPLVVLEAVGSEAEGPFVCWQACALPLANMKHPHRHTVGRYLHLRRLRQQDEHARRERAREGSELADPVVSAWQQSHLEAALPPLTLSPAHEPQNTEQWRETERKEAWG